ncbi:MAG: hypothetical protein LBH07_08280 [Treponema sp.]|nr:hypothetical protein [Treponema sp.]
MFLGILILLIRQVYAADVPSSRIQDDSSLRTAIKDTWFTENPALVQRNRPVTRNLPGNSPVQIRTSAQNRELSVILARERNGSFPGWEQGSWIYTRNFESGAPLRIRVFLRSDPNMYVQFRPLGTDKSQIDLVLYEAYIVRGLPIGLPFEQLLTLPVNEALALAGNRFPRHYFDPDPQLYFNICPSRRNPSRNFIARIRTALPPLIFQDDGALDENNRYVFIETLNPQPAPMGLNCSGFVKWVVDGMLRPITGKRLAITPLKSHVTSRNSLLVNNEAYRDFLFGLDWTRNLALEASRVFRSPGFATIENVEVRREAFAALIDRTRGAAAIKNFPGFLLNAGFIIEGLRPILYTLAVNEPGHLYLVSVSQERGPVPQQRQHYHVAVLIPYFNEYGNFQTAVFESAAETNLSGFIRRHPNALVNLVRIPIEGSFDP